MLFRSVRRYDSHSRDAAIAHDERHRATAGSNPHAAQTADAGANGVLEERPRDGEPRHTAVAHGKPSAAENPRNVAQVVARLATLDSELSDQPWKQSLERIDPAREQAVRVTPLRDGWSWRGLVRKLRAFNEKDLLAAVRERPCGEESCDTGAEHNGFATWGCVHG